jgi:hypothetical protein
MTKTIGDDHKAGDKRRKDREATLGKKLRSDALAFVGSTASADQPNLPRELYLPGLIATYLIFVIGSLLAIYGVDENREAKKVIFFSLHILSASVRHCLSFGC